MGSTHIEQHWGADNSSSFRFTISSIKLTLCNVASLITNTISEDSTTRSIIYIPKEQDHHSQMSTTHMSTYSHMHVYTYTRTYLCMVGVHICTWSTSHPTQSVLMYICTYTYGWYTGYLLTQTFICTVCMVQHSKPHKHTTYEYIIYCTYIKQETTHSHVHNV